MKPPSASDVLRKNAPRETIGQTFAHRNRYDKLRENSPAPSLRGRSDSVSSQKRKVCTEDDPLVLDCNAAKVIRVDTDDDEEIAKLESKMSKVSTMCGKMLTTVQQLDMDDPLRAVIADLIETVRLSNEVQEEVHQRYKKKKVSEVSEKISTGPYGSFWDQADFPAPAPPSNTVKYINRKKPAGGLVSMVSDERGKPSGKPSGKPQTKPAETEEEKKLRKFGEAIRDAERSALCFNLDMGNVPIMNKQTISEKASLALAKMAAAAENRSFPSPDKIEALDDITSMVTNMELYGSSTKQYTGKDSTGFCTVPVRYQFKDREQKTFAEKTLRDICKVKCSTPYPAIVRECIKQVVAHVREVHPKDFVRVSVMTKDFSLKVARRPPGKDLPWYEYPDLLRLPNEALDVSAKKAPAGLRMFFLPSEPQESMVLSPKTASPGKDKASAK